MRKLLIALASAAVATQASATNIFVDTFDGTTNPSFYTDYNLVTTPSPSALYGAGDYAIGANAADYHNLWASYTDHTSGTGNYLIANGYEDTAKIVWQSGTISLAEGTYTFSAWVANSCCNAGFGNSTNYPPMLTFSGVVGQPVSQTVASAAGMWEQVYTTFTVGTGGASGKLTLSNAQGQGSGNDFGVDDIVLSTGNRPPLTVTGVPEAGTWAMMVIGFGAIGAASRRRRTSLTFA